jgi:hypothetical protein
MPLPTPRAGQSQSDWIKSCMSNRTMKKEFPDNKQRLGVCYSQWKRKNKAKIEDLKEELSNIKREIYKDV